MVQIVFFTIFLMYYYKFKTSIVEDTVPHRKLDKQLIKIGIVMGAIVGISQPLWLFASVSGLHLCFSLVAAFSLVIQQIIVMVVVTRKTMSDLC